MGSINQSAVATTANTGEGRQRERGDLKHHRPSQTNNMTEQNTINYVPTVSERKKSLLCHHTSHTSPDSSKEKSNPILNNFSIKPIIQFFNRKLKKDGRKGQRRNKLVVEKDYHSDTYVMETNFEHHKSDGDDGHLQKKVYDGDKNKRA